MHKPTPQQAAYYAAGSNPYGGSIALKALAGTGKTFSQAALARLLPGSGLATSVMRSTTTDLAKAMPPNWTTKGMHAIGYAAIRKKLPHAKVDVAGSALYTWAKEALSDQPEWWKPFAEVRALIEQAMLAGIVPNHDQFIMPDTPENWELLADRFDIDWSPLIYSTARNGLIHLNNLALQGTIQFTHMLTLPLFWRFPIEQFPKIIVDEAQDLNPLQHHMIAKILRPNGRVFITGDPNQAILAFSGADANSFYNLVEKFSCQVLPLTWCWRCGTEIIREAQQYVPELEAAPNAHQGEVRTIDTTIDLESIPRQIICRNNSALTKLAMRLFGAGRTVECAGRDIGSGLKSVITRVASGKNADSMKSTDLIARLDAWAAREIARRPSREHSVKEKVRAITALAEQHSTLGSIKKHIESLYVDPTTTKEHRSAEFQLSTIHKAKGREWDVVGFLDPWLLPAKHAKQEWEKEQERHLAYVGVTRAKNKLIYLDSNKIA